MRCDFVMCMFFFFFQAEDGIRDLVRSRGLGDVYKRQPAAGLNYTNVKSPIAKPAVTTTYTVTITDRNGCTASDQVTITVMPPIVLTTTPVVYAGGYNVTCNGCLL